ncbi:heat shock 70 kDa protein 12A-like [Saccostrea echinata]|uniref:heat shock 70 kDa protein 12A-like n=1 Tax=Saccostrea echinata TaxID=191078 RepID=UPI002A7FA4DB|nr:heat shock 70 kDa protein 12A-like [Saccostrea echinata]
MEKSITSKCKKLIVAAIDFGTTFSGYAFSFRDNWGKVLTNNWQGGSLISHKAPTVLLLNSKAEFVAFGYEAEDKYASLTEEGDHEDHYLFQRFKMILHQDEELNRGVKCKDVSGKELEAGQVFAHCIRYLKKHLIDEINKSTLGTTDSDIEYVLTVPAIWGDKAKMFMREAAVKAGIKADHLIMALEPEAASIYCQHLPFEKQDLSATTLGVVKPGTKYMVVDLGGGTADITIHQKAEDNTLEELMPASGGPWGGKSVDDAFMKFLTDLAGEKAMKNLKEESMEDYVEILRSFETKKRTILPEKEGNTTMTIPQSYFNQSKKCHKVKDFKEIIDNNTTSKGKVSSAAGKLKWKNEHFREFFKKTIDSIVKHIDELFHEELVRDVGIILMVGGFSECELVQKAIKDHFKDKRVIIPEEAGLAVVKGAVYFGHVPQAISRRSARYTYGIQTWPEFNDNVHPKGKRIVINGKPRCKDVFFKYVKKGERITPGFSKSQIFQALGAGEDGLECAVFISDNPDPKFVDDKDCRRLGILKVPISKRDTYSDMHVEIEETMIFGETELRVRAKDLYTGTVQEVIFDLLKE